MCIVVCSGEEGFLEYLRPLLLPHRFPPELRMILFEVGGVPEGTSAGSSL